MKLELAALIDGAQGLRDATGNIDKYADAISIYLQSHHWKSVPKGPTEYGRVYVGDNGAECFVYISFTERPL